MLYRAVFFLITMTKSSDSVRAASTATGSAAGTVIYRYSSPLRPGTLLARYKRFLGDVAFKGEEETAVTVHVPNTGATVSRYRYGSLFPT